MYQCLAKIHPVNMLSISICTYVGAQQPHSYSSEKSASGQILNSTLKIYKNRLQGLLPH